MRDWYLVSFIHTLCDTVFLVYNDGIVIEISLDDFNRAFDHVEV